jgi:hypothetical protein
VGKKSVLRLSYPLVMSDYSKLKYSSVSADDFDLDRIDRKLRDRGVGVYISVTGITLK